MGCFGLYWLKREETYGKWLIKTGSGLFCTITLIQLGIGSWFLMSLDREIMLNYMGHEQIGSIAFMGSMAFSIVALLALLVSWKNASALMFKVGLVCATLVITGMVVMRHMLREYTVEPFFSLETVQVEPQWALIGIFVVGAVAMIGYLAWLAKVSWKAYNPS